MPKRKETLLDGETFRKSDGRYQYVYKDFFGKKKYIYARSLEDLRKKESEIRNTITCRCDASAGNSTLNQMFNLWLEDNVAIREGTRATYSYSWRNVENSSLGKESIKNIDALMIKNYYKELFNKGMKYSSVVVINGLIMSALKFAYNNGFIMKMPVLDMAKEFKMQKENDFSEKEHLSKEQFNCLINFCENNSIYNSYVPFLKIAFGTGMRIAEMLGLTWDDVDMHHRTINVNHTLKYAVFDNKYKFIISKTKNRYSNRLIPMTDEVYNAFRDIQKRNMLYGTRCESVIDGYSDFIFYTSKKTTFSTVGIDKILVNIEKNFNKQNSENPIPHLSAHVFRHSACSYYVNSGMNISTVQRIMGHGTPTMTLKVYTHANIEEQKAEFERLNLIAK